MEAKFELHDSAASSTTSLKNEPFVLRSYQAEMVDESLRSNIIVVMDTGSGKTHMCVDLSRAPANANNYRCGRTYAS
jgi:superfamily II DNA or RNA helicase